MNPFDALMQPVRSRPGMAEQEPTRGTYLWAMYIKDRALNKQRVEPEDLKQAQQIIVETRQRVRDGGKSDDGDDSQVAAEPAQELAAPLAEPEPGVCLIHGAPGSLMADLIRSGAFDAPANPTGPSAERPDVRVVAGFEYRCVDCGGPRSYASGKRCMACYQIKVAANKEAKAARAAQRLAKAASVPAPSMAPMPQTLALTKNELAEAPPELVAELSKEAQAMAALPQDVSDAEHEAQVDRWFAAIPMLKNGERPMTAEEIWGRSEAPRLPIEDADRILSDWGMFGADDEEYILPNGQSVYRIGDGFEDCLSSRRRWGMADVLVRVPCRKVDRTVVGAFLHHRIPIKVVDFYGWE